MRLAAVRTNERPCFVLSTGRHFLAKKLFYFHMGSTHCAISVLWLERIDRGIFHNGYRYDSRLPPGFYWWPNSSDLFFKWLRLRDRIRIGAVRWIDHPHGLNKACLSGTAFGDAWRAEQVEAITHDPDPRASGQFFCRRAKGTFAAGISSTGRASSLHCCSAQPVKSKLINRSKIIDHTVTFANRTMFIPSLHFRLAPQSL